jgi:hypothetical protein
MVVAALTADLRTFILTFMAIAVVVVIAPTLTSRPILGATAFARGLVGIVTAALGIWLLIHVYKTRLATPLTWLVATTVLIGALRFVFSGAPSQVVPAESSANGRLQLRIAIGDSGRVTQGRVNLRIAVEGAPSNEAVLVMVDGAVLRLRDGRSVRPKSTGGVSPFRVPDLPVGPSIRWLGSHEYRFAVNSMSLYLDPRDAHDVAEGLVAVELAAQVITLLPRVVGELPLRPGESLTLDGKKTRIDFVDHVGNVATVQIRTAEVASRRTAAESFVFGPQLPAQALVNANRREAMLLYSGSSGGGPEWLVLPGVSLFANEYSLTNELGARAAGNVPLDDAWYVDARLAIVRWVPTLNYPVRARATLR